jgi:hypothetical protein
LHLGILEPDSVTFKGGFLVLLVLEKLFQNTEMVLDIGVGQDPDLVR